jgi:hypothetical protein
MDDTEIKDKIVSVLDTFGMSGKRAAEITGISVGEFRKKLARIKGHYFYEHHYTALVDFIKAEAAKLD